MIIGDKTLGMLESIGQIFPQAKYQRCTVHFYRKIFSVVPKQKSSKVAKMLKAIHAQEDKAVARKKAGLVKMHLSKAADKVEQSVEETLTYMDFPDKH